ncbi:hypothetical protein NE237_008241 [Protea cynaroides]|nr:hypothetical protein NE237_008241 [Protea cynaroides]
MHAPGNSFSNRHCGSRREDQGPPTMERDYVIRFLWAEGHGRPESVTTVQSDLKFDTKSGSRGAKRSRRIPITKPVTGPRSLNSGYSMRSGRVVYDQKIIWVFAIYSVQVSPVIGAPEPGIAQAEVVVSSVYRIDPTKPEAEGAADAS